MLKVVKPRSESAICSIPLAPRPTIFALEPTLRIPASHAALAGMLTINPSATW